MKNVSGDIDYEMEMVGYLDADLLSDVGPKFWIDLQPAFCFDPYDDSNRNASMVFRYELASAVEEL